MRKINVLSLFDGLAGARVALDRLGIDCNYYASEIKRADDGKIEGMFAMQIAKANYPDIIHIGDVRSVKAKDLPKIDLLCGGSPCQDLSIAKANREGLAGKRSGLFWEYVRLLKECKPKWFLLENVYRMPKESRNTISKAMGCSPIMIDAALLTAQSRKRLYWTNSSKFMQPANRGIMLKDILEEGYVDRDKSYCIKATAAKGTNLKGYKKGRGQVVFKTAVYTVPRGYNKGGIRLTDKAPTVSSNSYEHNNKLMLLKPIKLGHLGQNKRQDRVYSIKGKSITLCGNGGGQGAKAGLYYTKEGIRKPTVLECERLQGLPEGYTTGKGVSNTQCMRAIGNGYAVPVIEYFISGMDF